MAIIEEICEMLRTFFLLFAMFFASLVLTVIIVCLLFSVWHLVAPLEWRWLDGDKLARVKFIGFFGAFLVALFADAVRRRK